MLRRSGLSKDQEHLIQTQVGADLTSGNVERAMYLILGQDYRGMQQPGHLRKGQPTPQRWKRSAIHNVWDEDADYEPNETAEDDLTYAQWHDFDEQDLEWNDDPYYESTYFAEMPEEYGDTLPADAETPFDTDEFDMVYSTYVDAKNRLNQLRQSRGFFPVVAVADGKGRRRALARRDLQRARAARSLGRVNSAALPARARVRCRRREQRQPCSRDVSGVDALTM